MDLRSYYQKIRDVESQLNGADIVIVSEVTPEGGKPGVRTEVPRHVAARLIAESRARVATDDEALEFYEAVTAARERHEEEEAAKCVQVMVIPKERV